VCTLPNDSLAPLPRWVMTPPLIIAPPLPQAPLQALTCVRKRYTRVEFILPHHYVDYLEREELTVPPVEEDRGVVLSGKLPLWLWTALARTYIRPPWVAIYYPQLRDAAVVIGSREASLPPGAVVSLA